MFQKDLLLCAVFSLEPLAQDPRNEITDLRRVNQLTPLPLPSSTLPGAWNWSCRRHSGLVVWGDYKVKITFGTACKIWFRQVLRRGKCSVLAPCVTLVLLVVHSCIVYGQIYTGCNRRNGPDFGSVFLRSYYTDITQNTYIQSSMVTEILAREVWNFNSYYSLIDYQIHIETGRNMWFL